jgi:hypothetical protein
MLAKSGCAQFPDQARTVAGALGRREIFQTQYEQNKLIRLILPCYEQSSFV